MNHSPHQATQVYYAQEKKINHLTSSQDPLTARQQNISPAGIPKWAEINTSQQKRMLTMPEMYVPIATLKTRRISLLPLHQSVIQQSHFKRNIISNETKAQCILARQVPPKK
ncbi:hypothetical protein PoB_003268900 [Plakobranchus ocellatus]|uniref:Uncharacterized protein n=1 Tax=Plakobranchus ocellatus TaxID=259542 RepID=A0AAV4AEU9_9GAST|nr:hypothetical protein PoB_003268900 [Plakobranchus ocellatus]